MIAAWFTALSVIAAAPTDVHTTMHRSPHVEHSSWLLGLKGVQLSAFPSEGEALFGGGVGLFAERTVFEGWLELELSASLIRLEEEEWVVPIDLLFKKPFHIGSLCPYFAVGPTMTIVRGGEDNRVAFGGAAVVGAYYWFGDSWGLDVEIDYALLDEDGAQHEITLAAGPTLRF